MNKKTFFLLLGLSAFSLDRVMPEGLTEKKESIGVLDQAKSAWRSINSMWFSRDRCMGDGFDPLSFNDGEVEVCLESSFLGSFERDLFLSRGKAANQEELGSIKKEVIADWEGLSLDGMVQIPSDKKGSACSRTLLGISPKNANPYGNFILGLCFKGEVPSSKAGDSAKSTIGSSVTARGFFGENSGPLRNIELVLQVANDYAWQNGFETVDIQAYKKRDDGRTVYRTSRFVTTASAALGIFCQPMFSGLRAGLYFVGDPFFAVQKNDIYGKEDSWEQSEENKRKFFAASAGLVSEKAKRAVIRYIQGVLAEKELFDGQVRIGSTLERQTFNYCDLYKPLDQYQSIFYSFEPFLIGRMPENLLPNGAQLRFSAALPLLFTQTIQEKGNPAWKMAGQALKLSVGITF